MIIASETPATSNTLFLICFREYIIFGYHFRGSFILMSPERGPNAAISTKRFLTRTEGSGARRPPPSARGTRPGRMRVRRSLSWKPIQLHAVHHLFPNKTIYYYNVILLFYYYSDCCGCEVFKILIFYTSNITKFRYIIALTLNLLSMSGRSSFC